MRGYKNEVRTPIEEERGIMTSYPMMSRWSYVFPDPGIAFGTAFGSACVYSEKRPGRAAAETTSGDGLGRGRFWPRIWPFCAFTVTKRPGRAAAEPGLFCTVNGVYGGKWVWWIWAILATCLFHSFEALNDAFEVQFFQGFIFTPYQRHWYHL